MDQSNEIWKPVVGYEGSYSVSNRGRVRSEARMVLRKDGTPCRVRERILRQRANTHGYYAVSLILTRQGYSTRTIHTLVASAFLGPRPDGLVVRHLDGVKTNNDASNLRYGTVLENIQDKTLHGTQTSGETHSRAKLTNPEVYEIRKLATSSALTQSQIAGTFGVSRELVNAIHRRREWAHLPG